MYQKLINERVINKNKAKFGRVVCLFIFNNVKIFKTLPIINEGVKNE